jgi:hypothetical protein
VAFSSAEKDPNRWFKVCIASCQICRKMVGLDTLGRRLSRRGVNQPERTIPGCKGMLGDHLRASFVKFDGG